MECYVPTEPTAENDTVGSTAANEFYVTLNKALSLSSPRTRRVKIGSRRTLVLGDFNARLNRDRLVKGGFGGPFVPDTETSANGERLLEFVSRHNLMVANSLFPVKEKFG